MPQQGPDPPIVVEGHKYPFANGDAELTTAGQQIVPVVETVFPFRQWDEPDVRSLITKVNAKGLGKVFDEHYAKHPITKAERKFEALEDFGSVPEEM